MYLSDRDIRALLPELGIEGSNDNHPFDPETQIQPCSIDLRVSDAFWKPSRRRYRWRKLFSRDDSIVDLRESHMQDLDPRRDWRPVVLGEGDAETIRPGGILMGRIYERFSIPPGFAGKVEGRSSFARLGLMAHCTGDFINPGWSGFMPLQLYNAGPYPIRVTPYLPICQLMLVRLSSDSERTYGQEDLMSKYVNDDGGPSFWWRDKQVQTLQERLGEVHAPTRLVNEVVALVRFEDPETHGSFESSAWVASRTPMCFWSRSHARRIGDGSSTGLRWAAFRSSPAGPSEACSSRRSPFGTSSCGSPQRARLWRLCGAALATTAITWTDVRCNAHALAIVRSTRHDRTLHASQTNAEGHVVTIPEPGLYRHFKGGEYELVGVARHSETEELLAVYRQGDQVWVRPGGHVRRVSCSRPRARAALRSDPSPAKSS